MRSVILAVLTCFATIPCRAELPVVVEIDAIRADAKTRIAAGDLSGLLADADKYLQKKERLADGRWKLAILYGALNFGFSADGHASRDWVQIESGLRALTEKQPSSANAWVFLAAWHEYHAWAMRGSGYVDTVSKDNEAAFERGLAQARAVLDAHRNSDNPAWYVSRMSVGGALGESPQDLDRLFFEAIRHEPGYQQIWFTRLAFLEPKWGGSIEDMVSFINSAARITSATEGRGMMARLLLTADDSGYSEVKKRPEIAWDAVKVSYDDVLKRFPDDWNAQRFFFEACRRSDKPEARHLLTFVKQAPSDALFKRKSAAYAQCVAWANDALAVPPTRDSGTGSSK